MKRLLVMFLLAVPALAANNRGPKGTTSTSIIDRGMMDVLYSRQDGTQTSDTTLFGDPNATATDRGWRIHRSKTAYLSVVADANKATFNAQGMGSGFQFDISGTTVFAFLPRPVDGATTNVGEFANVISSSRVIAPAVVGATNTQTFSSVDLNRCGGVGSSCTLQWVFRQSTMGSGLDSGRGVVQVFWNGAGAADLRGATNMVIANTDSNSVNVRLRTRAEIATDGSTPRLFSNVNRAWEVNQTKASRSVMEWDLLGTTQWTLNSTGDFVDGVGGNLVDTVDVSAHDHSGGGLDGSNLGTDSVAAAQIQNTVCTGVVASAHAAPSDVAVNYGAIGLGLNSTSATEGDVDLFITPSSAVVYHTMFVNVNVAPDNGAGTQSWTVTLRDDAADTSVACTISEAATTCTDTDSATPASGSKLNVSITPANTPAAATEMLVTICTGA